jgi:diadenosine tetraphosphate (Ap4A) HIT family hydrolase
MNSSDETKCMACQLTAERFTKPVCKSIFENDSWRIMHAFNTSLPGWLIIGALRHIETLADLTPEEAASLGELIRKTSKAVKQVTGAVKIYSIMFAEHRQVSHVHFHIVPRHANTPESYRSKNIFAYLNVPDEQAVSLEQRNAISSKVRVLMLKPSF